MNVPASISSFMTSSCQRYRSISLQAINIKMKFLSVLSKASWHQLFSQFFPCKHWIPLHQSFIQPILFQFLSSHKKLFFSPPSIFDFSFLAEVHEYYFTLHCGCISIDQEIERGVWRMCRDPAGLQTTGMCVMISQLQVAVADRKAVCRSAQMSLCPFLL